MKKEKLNLAISLETITTVEYAACPSKNHIVSSASIGFAVNALSTIYTTLSAI